MRDLEQQLECYKLLKCYKYRINRQQYLTFKGVINKGEYDAFRTGLFNLIKNKYLRSEVKSKLKKREELL